MPMSQMVQLQDGRDSVSLCDCVEQSSSQAYLGYYEQERKLCGVKVLVFEHFVSYAAKLRGS